MPDNELEQENAERTPETDDAGDEPSERPAKKRSFFNRRNGLLVLVGAAALAIFLALFVTVSYRYGIIDSYIKTQFTAKMADIGIVFEAEVFRVTVNPLALELKNATFLDRITGEKLFTVRDARLGLTIEDLFAWQLSRDITVNTTDINGAEVWVTFDEEGRSNFSNLVFEDGECTEVELVPVRVRHFRSLVRFCARHHTRAAAMRTAAALSASQLKSLAETLKAKIGKTVTLIEHVDPSLIGGLVVKVGSQMIDSSLKTKLAAMKIAMKEVG